MNQSSYKSSWIRFPCYNIKHAAILIDIEIEISFQTCYFAKNTLKLKSASFLSLKTNNHSLQIYSMCLHIHSRIHKEI